MKKQLPTLSIKGDSIQQLIELEMILVMLGYDEPYEKQNNEQTSKDDSSDINFIVTYGSIRSLSYLNHGGSDSNNKHFHASDVMGIINYVENYKTILK